MKKVLRIADLRTIDARKSKNSLITIARTGKSIWTQNVELERGEISMDFDKDEITLKFTLRDGEYLIMQDEEGSPDKMRYTKKSGWEKM